MGTLDAPTLRRAMTLYAQALEAHREEIDSLNVFPVPDGDTGTNMLLTQRAVDEALQDRGLVQQTDASPWFLSELGRVIAKAALMGARGNSGVILSQILRGFCERYCVDLDRDGGERLDGRDLARALVHADEEARKALAEPVEGTIVSVLRDAARAALRAAERTPGTLEVARAALEAAETSLVRTPERLDELRAAGVIDAGGKGLVLLLDSLVAALGDEDLSVPVGPLGPVGTRADGDGASTRYGYEVMYLATTADAEIASLRDLLATLGDSVVVVGGGSLYQVHVHTDDPGGAVEAGLRLARHVESIRIGSLDQEVAARCIAGEELREIRAIEPDAEEPRGDEGSGGQSVVAVAEGAGFARLYRSVGARVIPGGPGNNPSVRELVEALEEAPGDIVFLIPNHPNILPAAEAAAKEAGKRVEVLPSGSMAHGLAIALAFVPEAAPGENHMALLTAGLEACHGEVVRAEREVEWRGRTIEPGAWIGLSGEEILASGPDLPATVLELCRALGVAPEIADDPGPDGLPICNELLTLYLGEGASDEEGERVAAALREAFPNLDVEVHRSDQPRHPYLIGLE